MENVPELRFPEFSGEWETKQLKDITKINQGLQIPIADRLLERVDGSFFYITNEFLKENSAKKYFIVNPPKSVQCVKEDILMTRTGNTGQVVTDVTGAFHNNFFKIKYSDECVKLFLVYFLRLAKTQKRILQLAGASTIPDLNHGDFYRIRIRLPALPEQQKIANFLTTVDTKIQQLQQKQTLLQQYKKGVMQQLFSQALRFKDDERGDYPDWEEKRLGEVFKEVRDKVGTRRIETYSITATVGFVSQKEKFGKDISGEQNVNYVALQPGQLSYNKGNSKSYKYGCVYQNRTGQVIAVPNVFISFELENEVMPVEFYEQLFRNHYLDRHLRKLISSSARMDGLLNVNKKYFFSITVPVPSVDEQQKIANFLTAIDKKITQTTQQLEQAQTFKKGLLQQMFV